MESLEIERLKDEQDAVLAEREEQLRHGIRTRLEQQVDNVSTIGSSPSSEYARRRRLEADLGSEIPGAGGPASRHGGPRAADEKT